MRTLACLLMASILPATDLVFTNDDWPIETKDDLNTFDIMLENQNLFIQYRMLTKWRGEAICRRIDEIEGGLMLRCMFDVSDKLPIGVCVLVQGDLDGQSMQQQFHKAMDANYPDMTYDDSVSRVGLWFNQKIKSDMGDWELDSKLYNDRISVRLDYSHTCTIQGFELTAGAFGRFWFENTEDRISEEVNRKLNGFGVYGQIEHNSIIFNFSAAINDVRGGVGYRF